MRVAGGDFYLENRPFSVEKIWVLLSCCEPEIWLGSWVSSASNAQRRGAGFEVVLSGSGIARQL